MHFPLSAWTDESGALSGSVEGERAIACLNWVLTEFEMPVPIALDFDDVSSISPSFVETFLLELLSKSGATAASVGDVNARRQPDPA